MEYLLNEKRVAEILAVSVSWLQKGRVYGYGPPFVKFAGGQGAIRYRPCDVEKFIAAQRSKSVAIADANFGGR